MSAPKSPRSRECLAWGGAVLVALAAAGLVLFHTASDSASADEPAHIFAAYQQVFHGNGLTNIEHPPLAKEAAGLGLALLGSRIRDTPIFPDFLFSSSGHYFLFHNAVPADGLLAAARAPMLLFFVALLLLVFGAARRFAGTAGGFFAMSLVAFDPNFLAHAGIVHTDVPMALFWLAVVLSWGRVLEKREPRRILLAGVLLGASLATKFSSVYLLPTLVLVTLAWRVAAARDLPPAGRITTLAREVARDAAAAAAAAALAVACAVLLIWPCVRGTPPAAERAVIEHMLSLGEGPPSAWLARRITGIVPVSLPLAHYLGGLASVWRQNALGGGINYLNGNLSVKGFPSYFFVAFLVKSTLPFLATCVAALLLFARRRADTRDALLWVPVLYYFFFSMTSSYNIGIRHLLPIYPLLALAGARLVAFAREELAPGTARRRLAFTALAAVGLAQAAIAVRAEPAELSYFNALAGGADGGARILTDSNVDWGLDLRRLAVELRRRGVSDATVAYFGGDEVSYRLGLPNYINEPVRRGRLVAVSRTLFAVGPQFFAFHGHPDIGAALERLIREIRATGRPPGRIGGSILLYELPASPGR